ncbi:MAG TPA: hypothetical protein VIY08_00830 [Candidatus Nitrosocosmicus sp.]
MNIKCAECGKTIVAIGSSRKNGAKHQDWIARKYHKKCWIKKISWNRLDKQMQNR